MRRDRPPRSPRHPVSPTGLPSSGHDADPGRRLLLRTGIGAFAAAALGVAHRAPRAAEASVDLPMVNGRRRLVAYPGKRPLIVLTSRPPQLETPFEVFDEGLLTPNDAFFVRYHHAGLPTSIDGDAHVIRIGGNAVAAPYELTVAELRTAFQPVEVVAVNQCSGNGRGLFEPRVTGGQLGNGAMGNARWVGARLKDVLARARPTAAARQVTFDGLDFALLGSGDFTKALDVAHAMDGEVLVAYQMNGAELPMLNGFPVRLVVPGYFGTYWIKHLSDIQVIDHVYDGFWMKTAYRIPDDDCACVEPGTAPRATRPIGRFNVRSFITSLRDGARLPAGQPVEVRGIAFDGGQGVREVAYSLDGGQSWRGATLGEDLGRYSFRGFRFGFTPQPGTHDLRVRAWNRSGQSQPATPTWQPAGYMRNVVESVKVVAS
ncbi:MAG: molybdopterin-dependent oxidoreductase [Steroidobacteraceae bacterium]|jgi:DMSO/TMAO reductase YedYZ molybdopterin-dependent catalytic subunit|nr:molybdopterin-dependent oxidoreductase [Steroidobacteraceae bacterium]